MQTIRSHLNVKIAIFIHDVPLLMFGGTQNEYKTAIEIYNMTDLVIVPSKSMLDLLRKKGLEIKETVIQNMWDLLFEGEIRRPEQHEVAWTVDREVYAGMLRESET